MDVFHFMNTITPSAPWVFFGEYLFFTLPVVALLLTAGLFFYIPVFWLIAAGISFTRPNRQQQRSSSRLFRLIPRGMFEWQSGLRKNLVVIIIFFLTGLCGFFHIGLSAASLFMLTMVFVSMYAELEPQNMLEAREVQEGAFLNRKIVTHSFIFSLLLLPVVAVACVHTEYLLYTLGYFFVAVNLLVFSILLKYYNYRPSSFSGAHQVVATITCFTSVILAIAPLVLIMNLFLYAGARKNIRQYLHDYQ